MQAIRKRKLVKLKKRADFVRVASSGHKFFCKGFVLQVAPLQCFHQANKYKHNTSITNMAYNDCKDCINIARFGVTATKRKIGCAVRRNRVKRRLRAIALDVLPFHSSPQHDFVLIATQQTLIRPYEQLKSDLLYALRKTNTHQLCD